ncbi:site-specific DNA-methyltransferase [Paracoccus sp. 22332]|uniref:site-specific DNA-methyltransferase n=1 Tax=Paracoccus sp. 22332 TaxID=3453913 RepID=UPI003F825AAB
MKNTTKKSVSSMRPKTPKLVTSAATSVSGSQKQPVLTTPNQSAPDLDGLELLDREDLIAMVKRMVNGGVSLSFHGKRTAMEIARKVRPRITRRISDLHVGSPEEQSRNMLIEGENLQAMVTLYKYRGQIDLILTDPPYNTGQYFRYNDRWDEDPNDPELGSLVTLEDGSRHTKWMKAMLPRLQVMRSMLKPNGVVAMCIDDNELYHLGLMMDEVFGEQNRIAIINWQKSYAPKNDSRHVSTATEYVLVYANDKDLAKTALTLRTDAMNARYKTLDGDAEPWTSGDPVRREARDRDRYAIQSPFTGALHYPGANSWRIPRTKLKQYLEEWGSDYVEQDLGDGRVKALMIKGSPPIKIQQGQNLDSEPVVEGLDVSEHPAIRRARAKAEKVRDSGIWPYLHFLKNGDGRPRVKRYLSDVKKGKVPLTYWADEDYETPMVLGTQSWDHEESGHSQAGINELNAIVGKGHRFDTVKPLKLMEKIIQLWCPPNGLVMDPYAGSGTTGHAVLDLNHKTQASRRFILIEQGRPDNGDKYARTLTWQRLHNAITGNRPDQAGKLKKTAEPLGGGFEFRALTTQIDAKTVLTMKKDELIDVVITSHWQTGSRNSPSLVRIDDPRFT